MKVTAEEVLLEANVSNITENTKDWIEYVIELFEEGEDSSIMEEYSCLEYAEACGEDVESSYKLIKAVELLYS